MALTPCSRCARHVRTHEPVCPFCGIGTPSPAAPPRAARWTSLTRATVFYLGATAAACGSEPGGAPASTSVAAGPAPTSATPASVVAPPSEVAAPSEIPLDPVVVPTDPSEPAPAAPHGSGHPHRSDTETARTELSHLDPDLHTVVGGTFPGEGEFPGGQGYGTPPAPYDIEPTHRGDAQLGDVMVSDSDAIDPGIVTRTLATRRAAFRSCYERELRNDPTLAGRVTVSFDVTTVGTTDACQADQNTFATDAIATCLTRMVQRLRFAPPPETAVHVQFPVTFTPVE